MIWIAIFITIACVILAANRVVHVVAYVGAICLSVIVAAAMSGIMTHFVFKEWEWRAIKREKCENWHVLGVDCQYYVKSPNGNLSYHCHPVYEISTDSGLDAPYYIEYEQFAANSQKQMLWGCLWFGDGSGGVPTLYRRYEVPPDKLQYFVLK